MEDAGYNSAAVVGLVARGRVLGALSFLHAHDLRYDQRDLEFLGELGDRAAIALDNARLYEERAQIAADLQRGLRPPEPPYVEGLDLSVVFEPAGEGTEIGGDFYDVLPDADGCWLLVGDVAGKGSAAAAVSVGLRHAVRGLTRELSDPVAVLGRINELLREGRSLHDFATAQLIRLWRRDEEWELELAAAGHPAAVKVSAQGAVQFGGGTILGAWEEPAVQRHRAVLAANEALVLSTDGWFEIGPAPNHRGPEDFAAMACSCADEDLARMTECLRADAISRAEGELKDDMVVFAVRAAAE
jgi:serine phosphatase RsbU (regulator of sigma subunit)